MFNSLAVFRPRETQLGSAVIRQFYTYDLSYLDQLALFASSVVIMAADIKRAAKAKRVALASGKSEVITSAHLAKLPDAPT